MTAQSNSRKNHSNDGNDSGSSYYNISNTTVTSRIAFGSCHKSQLSAVPPIWETILPPTDDNEKQDSEKAPLLDAWLWLGDAMYPSHRDPITSKKYYGPAPPEEILVGLNSMKHDNATIGYKDFLARLKASNPANGERPMVTGVWDDHDFGGNDMGSGMPSKQERRRIYKNFLDHPSDSEARRPWATRSDNKTNHNKENGFEQEGMYHRVDLERGRIRILVLDTRWFREDHCIPSVAHRIPKGNAVACLTRWLTSGFMLHRFAWLWGKSGCEYAKVLGDEQWEWLESELLVESIPSVTSLEEEEEAPELFVILSSIQVWSTNPIMEGWGHFPKEQERMWNLLQTHYNDSDASNRKLPPAPVLFLSGDVHHAEISGQSGYYEITSSGLTHHCAQNKLYGPVCEPILQTFSGHRQNKQGDSITTNDDNDYYIGVNYGLLEILEEKHDETIRRSVRASIRNTTGHPVLEVIQPLAGEGFVPVLPNYNQRAHTWDGHLIPYLQAILLCAVLGLIPVLFLRLR